MADQMPKGKWLKGKAKKAYNMEKIYPKRHIRQDQWKSKWNKAYGDLSQPRYEFISDYECIFKHPIGESHKSLNQELWHNLQTAKKQGTRISIVNIAHYTKLSSVEKIVKSGGFKGGMKKINKDANGYPVEAKFSWWSPIFYEEDIKRVRDTLGAAIQPFLAEFDDQFQFHGDGSDQNNEKDGDQENEDEDDDDDDDDDDDEDDDDDDDDDDENDDDDDDNDDDDDDHHQDLNELKKQFASSNPFNPKAKLYGNYYFQYGINELCNHYRNCFGDQELQFKILGTFGYKQEVMHAVVICSQTYGNNLFNEYPCVSTSAENANNDAVVTRDNNGDWEWKPQATGTEIKRLSGHVIPYPNYRRWEHVAFAFHIPEEWGEEAVISLPDLRRNLHYVLS